MDDAIDKYNNAHDATKEAFDELCALVGALEVKLEGKKNTQFIKCTSTMRGNYICKGCVVKNSQK